MSSKNLDRHLNITQIPSYHINLDKDIDRLKKCEKIFKQKGIRSERFAATLHQEGIVGCGLSHLKCLQSIKPDTIIFEDDIALTGVWSDTFDIPSDTDALYLGVSRYGYVHKRSVGIRDTVLTSQYNSKFKRIFNMCSLHSVVYLSQRYIDACINTILFCLEKGVAFDLGIASIHKEYKILTPNSPLFYQWPQAEATNINLEVSNYDKLF
jgi:GR25 family glycosyltransferase involved in LPS biosynthesis